MVFRQKARTSQVPPIIGYEEQFNPPNVNCLKNKFIFLHGDFLPVQGVSELHLCGRRGKNIHFWLIHSLRTAKDEM